MGEGVVEKDVKIKGDDISCGSTLSDDKSVAEEKSEKSLKTS